MLTQANNTLIAGLRLVFLLAFLGSIYLLEISLVTQNKGWPITMKEESLRMICPFFSSYVSMPWLNQM
jgi:hypothetical protein